MLFQSTLGSEFLESHLEVRDHLFYDEDLNWLD